MNLQEVHRGCDVLMHGLSPAVPPGLRGQCALKSFQVLERDGTRLEEVGHQEAR